MHRSVTSWQDKRQYLPVKWQGAARMARFLFATLALQPFPNVALRPDMTMTMLLLCCSAVTVLGVHLGTACKCRVAQFACNTGVYINALQAASMRMYAASSLKQ